METLTALSGLAGIIATWFLARRTANIQSGLVLAQTEQYELTTLAQALAGYDTLSRQVIEMQGHINDCRDNNRAMQVELRSALGKFTDCEQRWLDHERTHKE